MNIEKEIYKALIANANGSKKDVKGITLPTLALLKKGEGKTSIHTAFNLMFENGIEEIVMRSKHSELTLTASSRKIFVKPIKEKLDETTPI